jgi:hypothetical protein
MIKYTVEVATNGNRFWYLNNQLHREDGPAVEIASGTKEWWQNGKLHREDGPARELKDGTKGWWMDGRLHREDGPAIEYTDGSQEWWMDGRLHREDGPAIYWATTGGQSYYLNGIAYSKDEFLKRQNKSKEARELTVAEVEKLLGYPVKIVK